MDLSIREAAMAVRASHAFTRFFSGVNLESAEFGKARLRITEVSDSLRSPGYRFSRHSLMSKVETDCGVVSFGYGEGPTRMIALQKSIAESVERSVSAIAHRSDQSIITSSGWAAYLTEEGAMDRAKNELLERDALLLHWLGSVPQSPIQSDSLPRPFRQWIATELSRSPRFNKVTFLVSNLGEVPVLSAFIHDDSNFGFFSHSTGNTLERSLSHCLEEACRLADLYQKGFIRRATGASEAHVIFHSEDAPVPQAMLSGDSMNYFEAQRIWALARRKVTTISDFKFNVSKCGPLHIAFCDSAQVQKLFFGSTERAAEQGRVNLAREIGRAHV